MFKLSLLIIFLIYSSSENFRVLIKLGKTNIDWPSIKLILSTLELIINCGKYPLKFIDDEDENHLFCVCRVISLFKQLLDLSSPIILNPVDFLNSINPSFNRS